MPTKKRAPSWRDVKTKLVDFDRAGLIGLLQDLYAASKDNQVFLHARFALGDDVLKPYKVTIDRWLWPDGRLPLLVTDGIVSALGRGSPTEVDRQAVLEWLRHRPEVASAEVGDLVDGWYGWERRL